MKESIQQKNNDVLVRDVHEVIDELWKDQVSFLQDLVRHKSTLGNETEIQRFIQNYLQESLNLKTAAFTPDIEAISKYKNYGSAEWSYENRPVVAGKWKTDGEKTGKSLILQGHIDVVSAEPEYKWDYPPYDAVIEGNKLYGRGSMDMKAGVSSMIFAVQALQKAAIKLGADLQIHSVIEEECTGNGAIALLDRGFTADGALLPEPTSLTAFNAQLGVFWMRVKVFGFGAHAERASKAQNALNKAAYLIQALDEYRIYINSLEKHENFKHYKAPLNINTGVIKGGDWPSNVPSECEFEVRLGFYPDTVPDEAQQQAKDWLLKAATEDEWLKDNPPEIEFYGFRAPGAVLDTESALFETLGKSHETVTGEKLNYTAFTGTSDIRVFEEFGIPSTCYGPSGGGAHGLNEFVDLEAVKTTTKTLASFIIDWCKVKS
ncbi:ArgE/DapE family deacylase [Salipaludibacillus sp. CF4.18]|uniref:ArgE/DapE family deacylase n=1 Tax=Salipaludibacillus sp. CF4.18 TaxID=3373081 RepID=UPI003EE80E72